MKNKPIHNQRCPKCKKNPCVCPSDNNDLNQSVSNEQDKNKPPKVSWI